MRLMSASENADSAQKKKSFAERGQERGPIAGQYWVRFRVFFMTFRIMGNIPYAMSGGMLKVLLLLNIRLHKTAKLNEYHRSIKLLSVVG